MFPPRPPSPPSGPPRGTYFSRRNDADPLPPSPAFTQILARSMSTCYLSVMPRPSRPLGVMPRNEASRSSAASLRDEHEIPRCKQLEMTCVGRSVLIEIVLEFLGT